MTFNDHEGSTKNYKFTRERNVEVTATDFVPGAGEISADYAPGQHHAVTMHDGSVVRFTKVAEDYNPRDRQAAYAYLQGRQNKGEVPTGLLFIDDAAPEMHEINGTTDAAAGARCRSRSCAPAAPPWTSSRRRSGSPRAVAATARSPSAGPAAGW